MLLGFDIGSSSVKASIVDHKTGKCLCSTHFPKQEMAIASPQPGFAEQDPNQWWEAVVADTHTLLQELEKQGLKPNIQAIGISYQMHGLVCLGGKKDAEGGLLEPLHALRSSIIWCDSRAVAYGTNFTAGKLAWVREHEPEIYDQTEYVQLPGDYIAWRLTGNAVTTVSGLSEGMFWDMKKSEIDEELMARLQLDSRKLAPTVPTFGEQGKLTASAAEELGLNAGIPVTYRAGDQPNNALSLGVLDAGEVAATGGTSGVVYAVSDLPVSDEKNRVNPFVHVNNKTGILLCINSVGILNAWLHRNVAADLTYPEMNELAATAPIGADGLSVIPFGNGAERVLQNQPSACSIHGLQFNIHTRAHIIRAAHEAIAFAFAYGMGVMNGMGAETKLIRAGYGNLFLSPIFRQTLSNLTGARILLYDTDGSVGAARGAGIGAGLYSTPRDAFKTLQVVDEVNPVEADREATEQAYERWLEILKN